MFRTFALVWLLAHLCIATPILDEFEADETETDPAEGGESESDGSAVDHAWRLVGGRGGGDSTAQEWVEPGFEFGIDQNALTFYLQPKPSAAAYESISVRYRIDNSHLQTRTLKVGESGESGRWTVFDPSLASPPAERVVFSFRVCTTKHSGEHEICEATAPVHQLLGHKSQSQTELQSGIRRTAPTRAATDTAALTSLNGGDRETEPTATAEAGAPSRRLLQLSSSVDGSSADPLQPIAFTASVNPIAANGLYTISFLPIQGRRANIQWVDLHYQVNGGPIFNYRMGMRTADSFGTPLTALLACPLLGCVSRLV